MVSLRSDRGQASVEWVSLVALVALVFGALVAAGVRPPGTDLAESIGKRIACAVRLGSGCGGPGELTIAYGPELGALVAEHSPLVVYERGMRSLPVDFRECTETACSDGAASGRAAFSDQDEPVSAFTRVIDCRSTAEIDAECSGDADGSLYIQYWFYYPDSYTAPWGKSAYHQHDWESYQVRIGPDGAVSARASAHRGYDYDGRSLGGWVNQVGGVPLVKDLPLVGSRFDKGVAWGPDRGTLWVSDASHAGRVVAAGSERTTPRRRLWLIPLEEIAAGEGAAYDFRPITPPWLKAVWRDPESPDT